MDFFAPDRSATPAYRGPATSWTDLANVSLEGQRNIENFNGLARAWEDEIDARIDAIAKAGGPQMVNPWRAQPTLEERRAVMERIEGREIGGIGGAFDLFPHLLRERVARWEEALADLERTKPDLAGVIRASEPPSMVVAKRMHEIEKRRLEAYERRGMLAWDFPGSAFITGPINMVRDPAGMAAIVGGALWAQASSPADIGAILIGNLAGAPTRSLLRNAWRSAYGNAMSQAVLEPMVQSNRAMVGLESGLTQALDNIAGAAGTGAALDVAIRAPVRAINVGRGKPGPYGGVFRDAPEPAGTQPRPENRIPADLLRRADDGDVDAMREIMGRVDGLKDEPELRGAIAEFEKDRAAPVRAEGVPEADGVRTFIQMLRAADDPAEPMPRMPEPVPETVRPVDADGFNRLAREYPTELDRLMIEAKQGLDGVDPRLASRIEAAIESGFGEIVPLVEAAVRRMRGGEAADAAVRQFVESTLSLANDIGIDALVARADLHSGRGDPIEMAAAIRQNPAIVDLTTPLTPGVQMARALARLSDAAFVGVRRGEYDARVAQIVSDHVTDPGQHMPVLEAIRRAGITDLDDVRRSIPDLMEPYRDPDAMPLDGGSEMVDPTGPEAKAQVARMNNTLADNVAQARRAAEQRKEAQARAEERAEIEKTLLARADAVRAAIEREIGIVPPSVEVRVFTTITDLPERVRAEVERANAVQFRNALLALQRAESDEARIIARRMMEDAAAQRGVEGLADDGTIWIAAYAVDPVARMTHEVLHALVRTGQLTRAEVRILAARARETGIFSPDREALYRTAYEGRRVSPEQMIDMLDEEAAAHLIEARKAGKIASVADAAQSDGIMARIQSLMDRVRAAIERVMGREQTVLSAERRPADTAEALIDALLSGEIARRKAVQDFMRAEDISAMAARADAGPMMAIADAETGRGMRRDLDALGYYSKALEAARSLKQARGTPEQMLAQLKAAGVKDAEIEATGLRGFLDGKKSITRDEIVSHLEANRVGLREVKYSREIDYYPAEQAARDAGYRSIEEAADALGITPEQFVERHDEAPETDTTKWSSHSLDPSNPTYRETVLHLPDYGTVSQKEIAAAKQWIREKSGKDPEEAWGYGNESDYVILARDAFGMPTKTKANFYSSHFGEPNIVGHMMTSMVRHEGKPVYLIDQIQSDWGQKLREGGVRDEAKIAALSSQIDALRDQQQKLLSEWEAAPRGSSKRTDIEAADKALLTQLRLAEAELRTAEAATPGNPLVNTTDQWVNTTLRRAIRQAAEADADYIAIPHGDTVLSYNPGDEGGMRGFYGSRASEGIVPKNLRKLLEKIDKDAAKPLKVEALETPTDSRGYRPDPKGDFDPAQTGFTLFPLTDKIKAEVKERGQPMFAFAGERARTADLEALARAKEMDADGVDRTKIWTDTGWFKGVDGKWRFEIDDSGADLDLKGAIEDGWRPNQKWPIDHVLTHKPLQAAYPDMNERGIFYRDFPAGYDNAAASTSRTDGTIALNSRYRDFASDQTMRSSVLHEAQHLAQRSEGFGRGGSPREFTPDEIAAERARLMAIPEDPNSWTIGTASGDMSDLDVGQSLYRRLAGEVEARAVQKRIDLTPEQRRARPPWLDYDVPESEQIVRMTDGGPMFAMADDTPPDHIARLSARLTTLARTTSEQSPDIQARVAAALNALVSLQEIAAEQGIAGQMSSAPTVIDFVQASASRYLAQITDMIGDERAASIADDIAVMTRDLPTDPQEIARRLNAVLDQVLPEDEAAPRVANDNQLGPPTPLERDLADVDDIARLYEMVGACRL